MLGLGQYRAGRLSESQHQISRQVAQPDDRADPERQVRRYPKAYEAGRAWAAPPMFEAETQENDHAA